MKGHCIRMMERTSMAQECHVKSTTLCLTVPSRAESGIKTVQNMAETSYLNLGVLAIHENVKVY